jgi:hypothetical protein
MLTYSFSRVQERARELLPRFQELKKFHIISTVLAEFVIERDRRKNLFISKSFKEAEFLVNPSDFTYKMTSFESLPERYRQLLLKCKSFDYMFSKIDFNARLGNFWWQIDTLESIISLSEQPSDGMITLPLNVANLIFSDVPAQQSK